MPVLERSTEKRDAEGGGGGGEGGPGSRSEEEEEDEQRGAGKRKRPSDRSMPVSRSYKALVLGGRATVGVPHSEHEPRREHNAPTSPSFAAAVVSVLRGLVPGRTGSPAREQNTPVPVRRLLRLPVARTPWVFTFNTQRQ